MAPGLARAVGAGDLPGQPGIGALAVQEDDPHAGLSGDPDPTKEGDGLAGAGDAEHGHGQALLALGDDHLDAAAALAQPGVEVAAGVGDAERWGAGGVGGVVVAAGGPGDLADGVDLSDEGLALAVGAPLGAGGQPLPPGHRHRSQHGADRQAQGGLAGEDRQRPSQQRADPIAMQEQPPRVDVQPQQVGEAVTGRLEDPDFDAEQGGGGREDGPPGEADLAHDPRSGDQVGGQGDHAERPQHHHQHEGAQAAGAPRRPRIAGGGGDVHAAPS
jgi:hypothetical protein